MKKEYIHPRLDNLILVDVLAESGDNLFDDSYNDGFDDEEDIFEISEDFQF